MSHKPARGRLLVIDDDEIGRRLLLALLSAHDYAVDEAGTGEAGLELLRTRHYDLVLLDLHLPGKNGVEVLTEAHAMHTAAEFILITAFGSVDTAVDAMKRGAYDYLRKPLHTDELLLVIERALADTDSRRAMARLKRVAAGGVRDRLIGAAPAMERLWDQIEKVAPTRATVLITGETGTGKELVAHAIHELSPRARAPFVATNCASLSETLLQSELFGHIKGSFTGALSNRKGVFEEADTGTLFLDEIATISPAIQIALLRVIQEREIFRVGSARAVPVDLRLLAATNIDLGAEVARGAFREDLYYRLNVFPLRVPPLRERREDIVVLARHYLAKAALENGLEPPELPPATADALSAYHWPGNVRELMNVIESAVIAQAGTGVVTFTPPHSPAADRRPQRIGMEENGSLNWSLDELERERIFQALIETRWHRSRAAALLGIDRRTLYRKLKMYEAGLDERPN